MKSWENSRIGSNAESIKQELPREDGNLTFSEGFTALYLGKPGLLQTRMGRNYFLSVWELRTPR